MMTLVINGLVKKLKALIDEQGKDGKLVFDASVINNWIAENGHKFVLSVDRVTGKLIVEERK